MKQKLADLCKESDKEVLIRIACHELEAWYFGDLEAVFKAYRKDLSALKKKKKYRISDDIVNPQKELQHYWPECQ